MNSETETVRTGSSHVYTRSSAYALWFPDYCFHGIHECLNIGLSDSYALSWSPLLCCLFLTQLQYDSFYFILTYFIIIT